MQKTFKKDIVTGKTQVMNLIIWKPQWALMPEAVIEVSWQL